MTSPSNTHAIDSAGDMGGCLLWNRLHSEREDVCEALLKETPSPFGAETKSQGRPTDDDSRDASWHRALLEARLRKLDDAMDRLLSGDYGSCIKCGRWIEDTKLDFDPAVAFCIDCWERETAAMAAMSTGEYSRPSLASSPSRPEDSPEYGPGNNRVEVKTLAPFDTICVRTRNSDYRIFLLDPGTGRALVEGGHYFVEPVEAKVSGSSAPGGALMNGEIRVGLRLEIWVNHRLVTTSPLRSFSIEHLMNTERASLCGR